MEIVRSISGRQDAEPFRVPVDWKRLQIPDYPNIIKKPMDLGTITSKLERNLYMSADDFAEDVRLVWDNAKTYNMQGSPIYKTAVKLGNAFEKKFGKLRKKPAKRKRTEVREAQRSDRVKFSNQVNKLSSEELGHIVDIIESRCPNALNEDQSEIEIEINNIDSKVLLELNQYAEQCINKSKAK
eukprot:jgi/Bigna1/46205/estExt_Genewise1.C_30053